MLFFTYSVFYHGRASLPSHLLNLRMSRSSFCFSDRSKGDPATQTRRTGAAEGCSVGLGGAREKLVATIFGGRRYPEADSVKTNGSIVNPAPMPRTTVALKARNIFV